MKSECGRTGNVLDDLGPLKKVSYGKSQTVVVLASIESKSRLRGSALGFDMGRERTSIVSVILKLH